MLLSRTNFTPTHTPFMEATKNFSLTAGSFGKAAMYLVKTFSALKAARRIHWAAVRSIRWKLAPNEPLQAHWGVRDGAPVYSKATEFSILLHPVMAQCRTNPVSRRNLMCGRC